MNQDLSLFHFDDAALDEKVEGPLRASPPRPPCGLAAKPMQQPSLGRGDPSVVGAAHVSARWEEAQQGLGASVRSLTLCAALVPHTTTPTGVLSSLPSALLSGFSGPFGPRSPHASPGP